MEPAYIAVIKSSATKYTVQYFNDPREAEKAGLVVSFLANTPENRAYCEQSCKKLNDKN